MKVSRRDFARLTAAAGALAATRAPLLGAAGLNGSPADAAHSPLAEFGYDAVAVDGAPHQAQLANTHEVLMGLSEDSLLRPFRQMAGQPAPGEDLGGWYNYDPNYDWHRDDAGFAPGATFGQWVSALARYCAMTGSQETRAKVLRLNELYSRTISSDFYDQNRFPSYCYDKLLLGLIDSYQLAGDRQALALLDRTTEAALPHLPPGAIDHDVPWRPGKDQSYTWDESYTAPENLFLAYRRGAGQRYRDLAVRFLDDDTWFNPLSRGENVLAGRHAYSYVNSLSSAMQAYLTLGSERHLRAAANAFEMLSAQSYPTGGWGPDESLTAPDGAQLHASLTMTHNSFETPCGAYAHFKLTRYLLRVTRDARYGDSMERVMYNTVLGARPLQPDGRAFYYADYSFTGRKVYSNHRFPCCSGTLPQVATDYGINTYLRDAKGVCVNLYVPSRVKWRQQAAHCTLRQSGEYPFADTVSMQIGASRPQEFTVYLRIPAWAMGARIEVNGQRWRGAAVPGSFAAVARRWRDGDRIELELPRHLRLEALHPKHPDTVALLCGPLVLFPVNTTTEPLRARRTELLQAQQKAPQRWETAVAGTAVTLLPYVAIDGEPYSTFVTLAG
ncbi:MAG TPA: beta-L-arabinofuranosidase domain-containing protein [Steroidobacteraceae bacterium]|nr:beta-L-arabinofuranosidase domain-containing protein [Steroidobacteraceae bacterium]